jgi:hypothetical protein
MRANKTELGTSMIVSKIATCQVWVGASEPTPGPVFSPSFKRRGAAAAVAAALGVFVLRARITPATPLVSLDNLSFSLSLSLAFV